MNVHCHCGHPYADHHVSAYGSKSMVRCDVWRDCEDGIGQERCSCVRQFAVADIPGSVRPINARNVHPKFAEIETCVAGMPEGLHRWSCHQCLDKGPPDEDPQVCRGLLTEHLVASHGVNRW